MNTEQIIYLMDNNGYIFKNSVPNRPQSLYGDEIIHLLRPDVIFFNFKG